MKPWTGRIRNSTTDQEWDIHIQTKNTTFTYRPFSSVYHLTSPLCVFFQSNICVFRLCFFLAGRKCRKRLQWINPINHRVVSCVHCCLFCFSLSRIRLQRIIPINLISVWLQRRHHVVFCVCVCVCLFCVVLVWDQIATLLTWHPSEYTQFTWHQSD